MGLSWANHLLTGAGVRNHLQYLLLVRPVLARGPIGNRRKGVLLEVSDENGFVNRCPLLWIQKKQPQ